MIIDSIEIHRVSMPLVEPFKTACGDDYENESVLVRLSSGTEYGWGEAAPGKEPTFCHECAATQFIVARDHIAPRLLGATIDSGEALNDRLSDIKGNQFAKAAFDLAWWDLHAKMSGEPLWRLLGGRSPVVTAGADFGVMDSIDELLGKVRGAVEDGYKRVKLKCRPGWDLDIVAAVREEFPAITLHIDCNSAYTLEDHELFEDLDHFNLAMIEQPLEHDDLIDHAALQSILSTPLCLDESIISPASARKAVSIGACRWVNIKPGRVGGITNSRAIHDICMDAGVGCWVGGMLESAVGAMHCLHLATLPNIRYASDIFPSTRFFTRDLAAPAMEHSAPSEFTASDCPGIGAEPDPELLASATRDSYSSRAN